MEIRVAVIEVDILFKMQFSVLLIKVLTFSWQIIFQYCVWMWQFQLPGRSPSLDRSVDELSYGCLTSQVLLWEVMCCYGIFTCSQTFCFHFSTSFVSCGPTWLNLTPKWFQNNRKIQFWNVQIRRPGNYMSGKLGLFATPETFPNYSTGCMGTIPRNLEVYGGTVSHAPAEALNPLLGAGQTNTRG